VGQAAWIVNKGPLALVLRLLLLPLSSR